MYSIMIVVVFYNMKRFIYFREIYLGLISMGSHTWELWQSRDLFLLKRTFFVNPSLVSKHYLCQRSLNVRLWVRLFSENLSSGGINTSSLEDEFSLFGDNFCRMVFFKRMEFSKKWCIQVKNCTSWSLNYQICKTDRFFFLFLSCCGPLTLNWKYVSNDKNIKRNTYSKNLHAKFRFPMRYIPTIEAMERLRYNNKTIELRIKKWVLLHTNQTTSVIGQIQPIAFNKIEQTLVISIIHTSGNVPIAWI